MSTTYHNGHLGLCRRRAAGVVAGYAQPESGFGGPWRISSMFGCGETELVGCKSLACIG